MEMSPGSALNFCVLPLQDAMQRSTLVPIADFLQGKDASQLQVGQRLV